MLNQLIVTDLDLQPLSTSDKAWCWFGFNYTDDEASLEQLAVRFKNGELAKQFYDAVQSAIAAVKEHQATKCLPSTLQECGIKNVSGDEHQPVIEDGGEPQPVIEEVDDQEEDDEDDDDDGDDR